MAYKYVLDNFLFLVQEKHGLGLGYDVKIVNSYCCMYLFLCGFNYRPNKFHRHPYCPISAITSTNTEVKMLLLTRKSFLYFTIVVYYYIILTNSLIQ